MTLCCDTVDVGGERYWHHLSPALAFGSVELKAQQSGSDHAEPVDVHHLVCILTLVAKNTGRLSR